VCAACLVVIQGQGRLEAWAAEAPARGNAVTKKPWDLVTSGPPPGLGREAAKVDEHELAMQALAMQVSAMWAGTQRARGDGTQLADRRLPVQTSHGPWAAQHMALTPQQQHGMMLMMMDEGEQGRHRRRTRRGRRGQGKRKRAAEARCVCGGVRHFFAPLLMPTCHLRPLVPWPSIAQSCACDRLGGFG
jgi:hypothetical protein